MNKNKTIIIRVYDLKYWAFASISIIGILAILNVLALSIQPSEINVILNNFKLISLAILIGGLLTAIMSCEEKEVYIK